MRTVCGNYLYGLLLWRRARKEHREFCTGTCYGHSATFLSRAVVNFGLIGACLRGQVVTDKPSLRKTLIDLGLPTEVMSGWKTAHMLRRQDREADLPELAQVGQSGL